MSATGPMADQQGYTLAGILAGLGLGFGPRLWEKWANRRREAADTAESLAGGAGAVTAAAVALLARHDEDAKIAREAEAKCRRDLAAANARIDAGDDERSELRIALADLRRQVETLRAFQTGP